MFTPVGRGHPGEGPTPPAERKRAFQLLFGSLICLGVGQSLMFAILPPVSRELGMSEFQVGAIFAVSATIWVFTSGYWGPKSDHLGRRPMILMGLVAFGVSTMLFASSVVVGMLHLLPIAVVYALMVGSRSIYGLFGSGAFPAAQAYVADRTKPWERTEAVATLAAAFGLGTTIGPGLGAALVEIDLLAPFYLVSLWAFVSAFAIWRFLPERTAPRERLAKHDRLSPFDRRVVPFIVANILLGTAGAIPIQTVAFFFMDVLHLGADESVQFSGVGLMASSMAALFAQLVLVHRFHLTAQFLVRWGSLLALVSLAIFVFATSFGVLVFALMLSGLGFGMVRPGFAAASSLAVGREHQGAVAGLTGAAGASGFIFAPLIGNALYGIAPQAPYIFGTVLMALLCVFVLVNRNLRHINANVPEEPEQPGPNG